MVLVIAVQQPFVVLAVLVMVVRPIFLLAREFLFYRYQKDNPHKRIFIDAKLSTVVITGERKNIGIDNKPKIRVKVYPANNFNDYSKENTISLNESSMLDSKNLPIPLVDAYNWKICKKIHSKSNVVRLGEIDDYIIRRGEINQTIYRKYITDNPKMTKLLKGVEVGRYRINEKLSQGYREWFDEKTFLDEKSKKDIVEQKRIATQRITGVDERLRIVATIIDPKVYFADSTNSISIIPSSKYSLEYLLGLINSSLFQWRFKLTSTNNNVGTNELNSMPFRKISFSDKLEVSVYKDIVSKVKHLIVLNYKISETNIPQEKEVISRKVEAIDRKINRLVYNLYYLTEDKIKIVESET